MDASRGIELDIEAIRATLTRPYTLLPINEHEAWLIHWRGVKMPIFGWVVAQEPAFIKAKVTRSMDLLTPLPGWMKQELGWKPPAHKAIIDGTRTSMQLTEGDESSFKRRYGNHLGARQADGSFKIKGGDAWIKLVAALVRDGILPYAPTPVAKEHWDSEAKLPNVLAEIIAKKESEAGAPYIFRAVHEFVERGAVAGQLSTWIGEDIDHVRDPEPFPRARVIAGRYDHVDRAMARPLEEVRPACGCHRFHVPGRGESGPGCRPFDVEWARSDLAFCRAHGIKFFMKQLGGWPDKRERLENFPEDLRIREFPDETNGRGDQNVRKI